MRNLLILFLFALPVSVWAQNEDSAATWFRQNYTKKEVYIPMRDGVKLFTSIYLPKNASEKHPMLMTRTPYSCAPYGGENYKNFYANYYNAYLHENYIMVTQDVRGRWMSEGTFVDMRPFNANKKTPADIDEASDTYDTVDWLVKNLENNNGNVGVFGISYPGFYSTMAAMSQHPAVKAVSPQAPVTDWFIGDDFHHNGAFFQMDAFSFYSSFGKPRPKPTTKGATGFVLPTQDQYDFYLKSGTLSSLGKLFGDSIAFWKDMMAHPNYDAWWKARNAREGVGSILPGTATLVVGGLFDAEDCFGAWSTYKAIEQKAKNNNKLVVGPWYHGQWARGDGFALGNVQFGSKTSEWYAANIEVPYFNYYLKGKGNIDQIKEANIFFTGENTWKTFDQWPLSAVKQQNYYLRENQQLGLVVSPLATGAASYTSDPAKPVPYAENVYTKRTREYMTDDQRFAARRTDVLVFETPVLSEKLTLAGPVIADLVVSMTGTDADFVVKLIDVFPDDFRYATEGESAGMTGYQMLVRGEIMRGKFRNSFEKPEAFVPGKPTPVKFTLPDVAHTFLPGHRMMVQIQSSWFPLVDRNPQQFTDIYHAKESDFKKAEIKVYHNRQYASKLILPVLSN
jgi:putative CocE/NonD family hydrolase